MWTVRVITRGAVEEHRDIAQIDDASGIVHVWQLQETTPGLRERVEVGRYEAPSIIHMDVFWTEGSPA